MTAASSMPHMPGLEWVPASDYLRGPLGWVLLLSIVHKQPSHKELGLPAGAYVPELKQTRSNLRDTFGNIPSCQSPRTLCHSILIGELQSPGLQTRHLKTSLMSSSDNLCSHIFDCYPISTIPVSATEEKPQLGAECTTKTGIPQSHLYDSLCPLWDPRRQENSLPVQIS